LVTLRRETSFTQGIRQIERMMPANRQRHGRGKPRRRSIEGGLSMRAELLVPVPAANLPGQTLIRVLAATALTASAIAGTALALALASPAHAETLMAPRGFTLPAGPTHHIGPSDGDSAALAAPGAALATRTTAARAAIPHFRLEADDGAVSTIYHVRDYDLRLEYGTVFARGALVSGAVPGEPAASLLRGRLMSRVVTRF